MPSIQRAGRFLTAPLLDECLGSSGQVVDAYDSPPIQDGCHRFGDGVVDQPAPTSKSDCIIN